MMMADGDDYDDNDDDSSDDDDDAHDSGKLFGVSGLF